MLGIYVHVPIACFRKGLAREYLETEALPPPSTCYGFLLSLVGETNRHRHVGARVAPQLIGRPDLSVVLRTVWRVKGANGWRDAHGRWHLFGDKEQKAFRAWATQVLFERTLGDANALSTENWDGLLSNWLSAGKPIAGQEKIPKDPERTVKSWLSSHSGFVPVGGTGENARPDYQQLLSDVRLVMWLDSSNETHPLEDDTLETRVGQALDAGNRHGIKRFGGLSLGESTHLVNEVVLLDRARAAADWSRRVPEDSGQAFLVDERGRLTLPVWVDHVGSAGTRYATGNLEHAPLQAPNVERVPMILPPG